MSTAARICRTEQSYILHWSSKPYVAPLPQAPSHPWHAQQHMQGQRRAMVLHLWASSASFAPYAVRCRTSPRSPYDTMEEVIGTRGTPGHGSLMEWGVSYRELDLTPEGRIDWEGLRNAIVPGGSSSLARGT